MFHGNFKNKLPDGSPIYNYLMTVSVCKKVTEIISNKNYLTSPTAQVK